MTRDTPIDVAAMLTEVGVDAATADPSVSVGDSSILRSERSVEMIPQYKQAASELTLETRIGESEYTEVYLGTQRSMRRKVAIRKVHQLKRTPAAPGYVLSEAWMLGAFEHPNILPVYAVSKDNDGSPLVAMKAIETVSWTEVLETPDHPLGCPQHAEPLTFNVERAIAVCSALEHAHHRGCIHRDVKPDNVLIGRDGTLYLHGWELAVSIAKDPSGRFPPAAEQTQIAGTPSYMAPELATRTTAQFGPATDVYLVGATLHEVVTGEPRHVGENVFDAFYSAVASTPVEYGPNVPAELATILNKAMAAAPEDRFQSMAELRHALESFVRHRPSERLTRLAETAHHDFSRAITDGAGDFAVRELFAAACTAYESARHFWPRNPVIEENLDKVLRAMIGYEIHEGSADYALMLLPRLSVPAPELARRAAEARDQPTRRQVADHGSASPPSFEPVLYVESQAETRDRAMFLGLMAALWSAYGFAFAVVEAVTEQVMPSWILAVVASAGWFVLGAFSLSKRRTLFQRYAARNFLAPVAVIVASSSALILASAGSTPHELVVSHLLIFFVAMAMLNAVFDARLIVSSIAYLAAYIVGSQLPELAFWLMGSANLVGLSYAGYVIHGRLSAGRA